MNLKRTSYLLSLLLGLAVTAACGDDEGETGTTTTAATTGSTTSASTTGGGGSASTTTASTTSGGGGNTGGGVHGCTKDMATDMTGKAEVTITDGADWKVGHKACILVDAGTKVTWNGNFQFHPLAGGVSPTSDATSPITMAGPGTDMTPVVVTFADAGEFPYFCTIHTGSMQGVVYVQ